MVRSILSVNATGLSFAATRLVMRVALFFFAIGALPFARQVYPHRRTYVVLSSRIQRRMLNKSVMTQ